MRRSFAWLVLALAACGGSDVDLELNSSRHGEAAAPEPPGAGRIDKGDGLTVEILESGTGAPATAESEVLVHYAAFVAGSETPFDSTYERLLPATLRLNAGARPRPIEGLRRGLIDLRAGTRAKLAVPAALGYGEAGLASAGVPANSDLVFEVRLMEVR